MSEDQYDVVIVGGGIAGAIVAKVLARQGVKRICILEAGGGIGYGEGTAADGYRSYLDYYYQNPAKTPNSPYPQNAGAPSPSVLSIPVKQPETKPPGYFYPDKPSLKSYFIQRSATKENQLKATKDRDPTPIPFLSNYERALGGTTLHWMGTCLRMLPNDFEMKTKYYKGVDWPFKYEVLRPYYELAEREIGVAGNREEQLYPSIGREYTDEYYWGDPGYVYPMKKVPQSYLDQQMARGLGQNGGTGEPLRVPMSKEKTEIRVQVESTPQGRNSTPNPNYDGGKGFKPVGMVGAAESGQRCEGNSSCVPICPVQAKYNAMKTLNSIIDSPTDDLTLDIKNHSVATKINIDADERVSSITYIQYRLGNDGKPEAVGEPKHVTAKHYVLAANAIENAKLLLASKPDEFDEDGYPVGIANKSGQVGRNLMDHLCLITWGLMPQDVGAYRGPGSTSGIASFRDGDFRKEHSSFRVEVGNWGWTWPRLTPVSSVRDLVDGEKGDGVGGTFGVALRKQLAEELPRQFRIAWEIEQLPSANNRVTIDKTITDDLGVPKPVIEYYIKGYEKKAAVAAKDVSDALFCHLNVDDTDCRHFYENGIQTQPGSFTYDGKPYYVAGAGHVVGTHRMGDCPEFSVVDADQRCHDHDNLWLVGCGSMPTLGTSNPTLTAAALAFLAGERIANDLNKVPK